MSELTTTRTATIGENTYELTFQTSSQEEYISVWLKDKEGVDRELEVYSKEDQNLEHEADFYVNNLFEGYYDEDFLNNI